jgi:hypothetical protein
MASYERFNLLIDSSKRTNKNETNTNFSVNLTNGYNVKMARLKSACIPLTFYNITTNNNHMSYELFDITITNHHFEFTIPVGRYSVQDLVDVINEKFDAQKTPEYGYLTLTFDDTTAKFAMTFTAGTQTPALEFISNMCFVVKFEALVEFMGFYTNPPNDNLFGVNNVLTSVNVPSFINTDYMKLTINYLGSNLLDIDNNQNNTTFFLELDTDYQNDYFGKKLLVQNFGDDTGCKNNVYDVPIKLQNFKITLTDRNDNIVDLNGVDWWALIEIIVAIPIQAIINELTQFIPPNNPINPSYLNQAPTSQSNYNLPPYMRF